MNRASTGAGSDTMRELTSKYGGRPWIPLGNDGLPRAYASGIIGLHDEILDFCQYVKPNQSEIEMRESVFLRVRDALEQFYSRQLQPAQVRP